MSYDTTWWNYNGANPPELTLFATPRKGEYGGVCNNPACDTAGADWYNHASFMYYCDRCAQHINELCLGAGTRKVCELHL